MKPDQARQIVNKLLDIYAVSAQYDALNSLNPLTHETPEPIWTVLRQIDELQLQLLSLIDTEAFTSEDPANMLRHFTSTAGNIADNNGHKLNVAKHMESMGLSLLQWVIQQEIKDNRNRLDISYQKAILHYLNPAIVRNYKLERKFGADAS